MHWSGSSCSQRDVHTYVRQAVYLAKERIMATMDLWILKFTEEGGVWASQTAPPPLPPLPPPQAARSRHSGSRPSTAQLEVNDFVLASGKRAQIKNILQSERHSAIAQLFFIDTAEEGDLPLHKLVSLPEDLMQQPLAQHFMLDGITPQLKVERNRAAPEYRTTPIGHPDSVHTRWGLVAMETLRNVAEVCSTSSSREVKVRADMRPGDRVVILCDSEGGELNFNLFLTEAGLAVPAASTRAPSLPDTSQLLSALESIKSFQTELSPASKPTKPVRPVEQLPPPYQYCTVYVDSPQDLAPHCSLEDTNTPGSVCKGLTKLGFQSPSPIQACGWPYAAQGNLTVLVSPPSSGKTLAYLLPLVTKRELGTRAEGGLAGVPRPRLVVLVASSWEARAVYTRARELVSWLSASRRFRCCCAYRAVEGEATVELLNGVEILVCTPTSLLRLVGKTVARLDSLSHLVLDNIEQLQNSFSDEVRDILALSDVSAGQGVEVVVTSSKWCPEVDDVPALLTGHTHLPSGPAHLVIACPIEATVKAGVKMDMIPCQQQGPESMLQQLLCRGGCGRSVVCVATMETAHRVSQYLETLCWPVGIASVGGGGGGGGGGEGKLESVEQLLQREMVAIIPDGALPSILPCHPHVSLVIHVEVPKKKSDFTNRLTLLYSAIHRKEACSHIVLLTSRWQLQAGLLKSMMERTNQQPPQPLLDMTATALQAKEEQRKDFDLCYQLKAWGSCSVSLCPSRHIHSPSSSSSSFPSPQPLQLPENGSVKLKVRHVSTATRWWVSLLGHAPLYRGAEPVGSHDPDGLMKMTTDLACYFTPEKQRELLHNIPAEGNYCALRDKDGGFYRVRILKFSRPLEFMFHHREKAKVRLIDVGEAQVVDVTQLLPLPDHLLSPPALVFEVFVCGVKPTDFDPDWPPQAAQAMRELYQDKAVHGRVVMVSGETVWLDPVEQRHTLEGLNITTALTSPQQQLLKAGMGEPNPGHLVNLSNCLGLPLVTVKPTTIDNPGLSFTGLPVGGDVEVCVSAVDSPNRFYLQLIATEAKVIALEESLNRDSDVASMAGCRATPLPTGSVCAAQFSFNGCWYRGRVLEVEGQESRVQFLDYGNVEWVPNHLVQPIDPAALVLPFQAIECSFGMEHAKWSTDASTLLYEWTRDLILIAKTLRSTGSSSQCGAECYTVELYEKTSAGRETMNMALRLLAARATTDEAKTLPTLPAFSSSLEQLCLSLSVPQTDQERETVAMEIKNTVFQKPGLCVSGRVLVSVCQFLSGATPPSVSVPLLQALCGLATFHSGVRDDLSHADCLNCLLLLMKSTVGEVVWPTLQLITMLMQHTDSLSVLCTESTVEQLLRLHRFHADTHGNTVTARHAVDISWHVILVLNHVLSSRPELAQVAVECDAIPLLCHSLTSSHPPSSSLLPAPRGRQCSLLCVVEVLGSLASLSPCQHRLADALPLEELQLILDREPSIQITHAILRLLIPLSDLPEFIAKLHSSGLLSSLSNLPMAATTGLLLKQLNDSLGSLELPLLVNNAHRQPTDQISTLVSNGYEDPPPPLIASDSNGYGDVPPALLGNGESSNENAATRCVSSAGASLSKASNTVEKTSLHPHVLWSQNSDSVLLAVQLRGCLERDTTVSFNTKNVNFQTTVWSQDYCFSMDLYSTIDPTASSASVTGSEVLLRLVKTVPATWRRLPHSDRKLPLVGIDFNRWEDNGPRDTHISSNWPTCYKHKNSKYTNPRPVDTDSDRDKCSDGSQSVEEGDREEGKGWEDGLDVGFEDV